MTSRIINVDGKLVSIGRRIGKGGEGEVFEVVNDPTRAIKLYFKPDRQRFEKVAAIVQGKLSHRTSLVSFPIELATDPNGVFVGFTMRLVGGSKPLHELYSPKARKQNFPSADYRFLVRTAKNLATSVASVHSSGCVIGDINHSVFLISDTALVALIDADSFQVTKDRKAFLCRVGVPEYTPPELQGGRLDKVVRTINHDAFGLAVAIFQLLLMGRHPFAGSYGGTEDMPLEKAIEQGRYAYSSLRRTGMIPPPNVPTPAILHKALQLAFEQAFTAEANRNRPTAPQWVTLLSGLEKTLVRCPSVSEHYFPSAARECPWCAMDEKLGTVLFLPHHSLGAGVDINDRAFDLQKKWALIEAVEVPSPKQFTPSFSSFQPRINKTKGKQAAAEQRNRKLSGMLLIGGAVAILVFWPSVWWVTIGLAVFGFNRFFSEPASVETIRNEGRLATKLLADEVGAFHKSIGSVGVLKTKQELERSKQEYLEIPKLHSALMKEFETGRRKRQLEEFLDRFRIDRSKIQSINRGVVQTLIAYGYETAADIDDRVIRVPGIGEVRKQRLLDWQAKHSNSFVFRSKSTHSDLVEKQRISQKIATLKGQLQKRLNNGPSALHEEFERIENGMRRPSASLVNAYTKFVEAQGDCSAIGFQLDPPSFALSDELIAQTMFPTSQKTTGTAPTGNQRVYYRTSTSTSQVACPKCGSGMQRRVARHGRYRGKAFWGCGRYPQCDGLRNIP